MIKTQINRLLIAVVLLNLCVIIGCHRGYYRRQADAEARRLVTEKSSDPRWDSNDGTIEIDPQSRMFDPFSADHPPIPPDDAASHQFMHTVDGKPGYPHWHANGDTDFIENPEWRNYLPVNEKGEVVLTLDRAYQLALINSPELQRQRETLYLSALDVSLDRFGFDSQLFGGFNSFLTTQGRLRNASGRSSTTLQHQLGSNGGGINLERLGITGTNFAVGLANTILFNFSGNNTQSATSLIDFSIIQPLLRGAGRKRIMESLTQAERTLLANVRAVERFRRGFYLQIAIGRNAGTGASRGGPGLGTPDSASQNAGGYFGLLEQQQQIRNQEFNVRQLESVLELFREFFIRERLDAVQLKQFETNVYNQQRSLLNLRTNYQTALDRFKITLGLPPDLDFVIDDSYLDKFELISDQINERLISTGALREETGSALNEVDNLFETLEIVDDIATGKFAWPTDLAEKIAGLEKYIETAETTLDSIMVEDREQLEADFRKLDAKRNDRLAYLESLQTAIESGKIISPVDPGLFETKSVRDADELREVLSNEDSKDSILNRAARLKEGFASVKEKISQFKQAESDLDKTKLYEYVLKEFQERIPGQLSELNNLVLEMSLLQALARSNSIEIIDVDITAEQAIDVARCMRRDWMNARAAHVDNWRNIEFVADQLEAQVDLVFEGDMGNNGDNPFKLRYETGQLRAGFRFDAPIVRLAERNQYRQALIEYQQSRRQFYQFEDAIKRNLREITRNLDRNKVLFELDRRTVQVGIENVEINRFQLEEPVGPNSGGSRLGATTAQNLTQAIIGLNNAQNSFLGSWVEFEVLRRNLDYDMGTMQLDEFGEWIDPGKIDSAIGLKAAAMMGIEMDDQYCCGVVGPNAFISVQDFNSVSPQEAPAPLRFENESPRQNEFEGLIAPPTPQAPQLNQPESSMQRRSVISRKSASMDRSNTDRTNALVPGLLFSPVKQGTTLGSSLPANSVMEKQIQTESANPVFKALSPSLHRETLASKADAAFAASKLARYTNPTPPIQSESTTLVPLETQKRKLQPLTSQTLPTVAERADDFQIQNSPNKAGTPAAGELDPRSDPFLIPLTAVSIQPLPTDMFAADRIADQFSVKPAAQTSAMMPANELPLKPNSEMAQLTASSLPETMDSATSPVGSLSGAHSSYRPTFESDWQSRPSSLGGVLNRFRTDSKK